MTAIEARLGSGREDNSIERHGLRHLRVVVVGAGFSGLSVASRLRDVGEKDFVVLERGEGVGGVWRDNTYPGAVCDVPSHLYSLSFVPNPEWDRAFSPGAQIKAYLESVVSDRGLGPWISLREELLDAAWDDESEVCCIVTSKRRLIADVLVSCAGPLTEPGFPDVSGLDRFRVTVLARRLGWRKWTPVTIAIRPILSVFAARYARVA
jgi:cation diffusion facilitator CzcD-associated flavoprotein CzcO